MRELKITDFAVIMRNIVEVGKPTDHFQREEILSLLDSITVDAESEAFTVMNQVSQQVCSLSKSDIIRFELPPLEVFDEPRLFFRSDEYILDVFKEGTLQAQVYPCFHRSGSLLVNLHVRFQSDEGFSTAEVVERVRLNLRTLAVRIPAQFHPHLQLQENLDRVKWVQDEEQLILVGSLKDVCSLVIRPVVRKLLQKRLELQPLAFFRCISSTLVHLYHSEPECSSLEEFIKPTSYGKEILGMGTLNKNYLERTAEKIQEELNSNLSTDEEMAVFTFGLSDLVLCDRSFREISEIIRERKKFQNLYSAYLYNTFHYGCLLEWVYFEKFIIDRYNRLLSRSIADEKTSPEKMLALQKQSMHDLIVYRAGITPFPSREEFLEKARIAHRIPESQEKLEKKRDLATDYVLQEYTLRTNRGIQLVNVFVAATATFGLIEMLLSIWELEKEGERDFWMSLTAGIFVVVLTAMGVSLKFFTQNRINKTQVE